MKILVPIKSVLDYEAKIKPNSDGTAIESEGIKKIVNPFDEIAVEEAVKIKEAGLASEVVVVSIGSDDSITQLRYAMAMGADRAIHVKSDNIIDSHLASKALVEVYKKEEPKLILMGKQAIDSDSGQTPQLIAARLNLANASYASKIEVNETSATVTREVDGGLETVKVNLPAVISTDLRLNEPRYAPLPGIMKAKKKPLDTFTFQDLNVPEENKVKTLKVYSPPERSAGRILNSVDELVEALKNEAKAI